MPRISFLFLGIQFCEKDREQDHQASDDHGPLQVLITKENREECSEDGFHAEDDRRFRGFDVDLCVGLQEVTKAG